MQNTQNTENTGSGGGRNLKNIIDLYVKKLGVLKKILAASLKIKDETDKELKSGAETEDGGEIQEQARIEPESESEDDFAENIVSFVDGREILFEEIKHIDLTIRHYVSELRAQNAKMAKIADEIREIRKAANAGIEIMDSASPQERRLYEIFSESKAVLDKIKAADKANAERISVIMENLKGKIKSTKENRNLMDKFMGGGDMSSAGTLLREKK